MTGNLSWDSHIDEITAKAFLDWRHCSSYFVPFLREIQSMLCLWSLIAIHLLTEDKDRAIAEDRWILKARKCDSNYNERLINLNLLPLCYVREIKDLILFYKALYYWSQCSWPVSFGTHNHSRLCRNPDLLLNTPLCKTTTYQNSYFNRIVKLWNSVCKVAPPNTFSSVKTFKYYLFNHYSMLVSTVFDVNLLCTWSMSRACPCHRS